MEEVSAFAPATIANLGPGFDWLGCAVEVRILVEWGRIQLAALTCADRFIHLQIWCFTSDCHVGNEPRDYMDVHSVYGYKEL